MRRGQGDSEGEGVDRREREDKEEQVYHSYRFIGFYRQYCPGGAIGDGCYYALNASYSNNPPYVLRHADGSKQLFLAQVYIKQIKKRRNKTKQNKTKQNKTKQNKTKVNNVSRCWWALLLMDILVIPCT